MFKNMLTEQKVSWYQSLKKAKHPVLIYQMGKVGSSALEKSIPNSIHLHDLMSIEANRLISPVRAKIYKPTSTHIKRLLKRTIMTSMLKRKEHVRIISLVREPIGRNISMLFQSLPFWMVDKYLKDDSVVRSEQPHLLHETFENHVNHHYPLEWFDNEIKALTGIDVFSQPFDHKHGYHTYQKGNFSLMVVRTDKLNQSQQAICDFLQQDIKVTNDNQSENKWYSPLACEFKNSYHPKSEFVEEMLTSKFTRHFFTESEIAAIKNKYTN